MNKKIKQKVLSLAIYFLLIVVGQLLPIKVFAVDVFLFSANKELPTDQIVVSLGLNTGPERINAIAGILSYDPKHLELSSISNANSIIPLWVEDPRAQEGQVSFSGIVPGGFGGTGRALSLVFKTSLSPEQAIKYIKVKQIEILRNDGSGQPVASRMVVPGPQTIAVLNVSSGEDKILPEKFKPTLLKGDPLLGNQAYLIFNTTDKGSGVYKYFVLESPKSLNLKNKENLGKFNWQEASSPYLLQDQSLQSYVYVKAVDRAGNTLVVELEKGKKIYQFWWFWVIIIMALSSVCFWCKRKFL